MTWMRKEEHERLIENLEKLFKPQDKTWLCFGCGKRMEKSLRFTHKCKAREEIQVDKTLCKKIPLHEFEEAVAKSLVNFYNDMEATDLPLFELKATYVAEISEAAVRILLDGDK